MGQQGIEAGPCASQHASINQALVHAAAAVCRFLRFPGGCYVEGVTMRNAFLWKPSVGPLEERPGHWNGPWEYWSTDGEPFLVVPG